MKEIKVYTVPQAAAILQCSEKSIYRLIKRQILVAVPTFRHKRILASSLAKLLITETEKARV